MNHLATQKMCTSLRLSLSLIVLLILQQQSLPPYPIFFHTFIYIYLLYGMEWMDGYIVFGQVFYQLPHQRTPPGGMPLSWQQEIRFKKIYIYFDPSIFPSTTTLDCYYHGAKSRLSRIAHFPEKKRKKKDDNNAVAVVRLERCSSPQVTTRVCGSCSRSLL